MACNNNKKRGKTAYTLKESLFSTPRKGNRHLSRVYILIVCIKVNDYRHIVWKETTIAWVRAASSD